MTPGAHESEEPAAESLFLSWLEGHALGDVESFRKVCAEHPGRAQELERLRDSWVRIADVLPRLPSRGSIEERLAGHAGEKSAAEVAPWIAGLSSRESPAERYIRRGTISQGGRGAVLRVWDADLRRLLAMKVMLPASRPAQPPAGSPAHRERLARFVEEAQVSAQLDHPGIVPVHELGVDAEGRVYFTMKLVKGQTLKAVFDELARGEHGWTLPRVLGLLLKVCEAMAYAHDKGVVHRDLKPSNVMVGRYGEVYVMDWGLAKVIDERAESPCPTPADETTTRTWLDTMRLREGSDDPESPLHTLAGEVIGTPAFMSPEQAMGDASASGFRSDVYSVGAMLYQLLSGRMPFVEPGARYDAYATWLMVRTGPPRPLAQLAPQRPAELIALCEKAMARSLDHRYASMAALADDMRAFLEGRVVHAFETGPWAEARKWMQRNRALASALAAAVLALVGGLVVSSVLRGRAEHNEALALASRTRVLQLSDAKRLDELVAQARTTLWPVQLERVPAMKQWLAEARALHASVAERRADLEALRREQGKSEAGDVPHPTSDAVFASTALAADASDGEPPATWILPDPATQWYHDTLARLLADLERLDDPDPRLGAIAAVAERIDVAERSHEASIADPAARELWEEAAASIRDREECPAYAGLELPPQEGLVPIGRDPRSGLWEFGHLPSGEPATRENGGTLFLCDATGIVLVLLPGGRFHMGAQNADPGAPNYDRQAMAISGPVRELDVEPCFLSKYEVTQGQWSRLTGHNPSSFSPEDTWRASSFHIPPFTLLHPVEQVSWEDCATWLARYGLALPSEAQWEYAARGGASTVFAGGDAEQTLAGLANIADLTARSTGGSDWMEHATWLTDGWCFTAPIGSLAPNAFGLHDVHGNVWEWCADEFRVPRLPTQPRPADPAEGVEQRVFRGGSFAHPASFARLALRNYVTQQTGEQTVGVRPARAIVR